jgi:hypothetical protein
MAVSPFINLFRTTEEAFQFKNSQINTQFIFKGIQLLPYNTAKYVQVTQTPSGLNIEDWFVWAVDLYTGARTNITPYFFVDSLTNDIDGSPQLYWSLTNVPFDFGYRLIYLEINQLIGDSFYSNPFMLTNIENEKTSQFHYKDSKDGIYQSISLQTWFDEEDKKTELTTYYEVSTKNTVSQAIKTSKIEHFRTELMPKSTLIALTYVLESPVLYVNYIRCSLFEAVDLPKKTAQENFIEISYILSPNYKDNFFGLADYNGIDYGSADYDTSVPITPTPIKIHNNVYSSVYN